MVVCVWAFGDASEQQSGKSHTFLFAVSQKEETMGLFDFLLSPSQKCEKEVAKFLEDVVKATESSFSDTFGTVNDNSKFKTAMIMALVNPAIETLKQERTLQKRFNLSDDIYDAVVFKASYKVYKKHIPHFDRMLVSAFSEQKP